jgi:hypothetical protein
MLKTLPLLIALALQTQASPTPQQIRDQLEAVQRQLQVLIDTLPKVVPITTAAELQAALDAGGTVELPRGMTFVGQFTISRSGTVLIGNGSGISASGAPALTIRPGVNDVHASGLVLVSSYDGAVLLCGYNGAPQTALAQQPKRITLDNITIPTHRGKRGIEFNCGGSILNSSIADVWATTLADSQAIAILNTCGPVIIQGGTYVAASENIISGGDTLKITDCPERVVADILIDNVTLSKPELWRTDGVRRAVKNLLELKAGKRVLIRDSRLSGSWGPVFGGAQDGSAIVITPKNGQYIADVTIENVTVDRAANGLQLMGKDYNSVTPVATTNVIVRNSRFTGLTKTWATGRGILALVVDGMQAVTFENNVVTLDGNAMILCDTRVPVGPLAFRGSQMQTGPYGVMAPGVNFGGPTPPAYAGRECVTTFEGNTLGGAASQFKTNYPNNTYVPREGIPVQAGG